MTIALSRMINTISKHVYAFLLLVPVCFFVAFSFFSQDSDPLRTSILILDKVLLLLIAAGLCWHAASGCADIKLRRSWFFIGCSCAMWALAKTIYAYYEVVLGIASPSPSIADVLWFIEIPVFILGLVMQLPLRRNKPLFWISTLDALIFALGIGIVITQFLLVPLLSHADSPLTAFITDYWIVADIVMVFVMVVLVMGWTLDRVPLTQVFLLAATTVAITVDMLLRMEVQNASYQVGNITDNLFILSAAFLGMAATFQIKGNRVTKRGISDENSVNLLALERVRALFPFLALFTVGFVVYSQLVNMGITLDSNMLAIITIVIVALIMIAIRQTLMMNHATRLTTVLNDLNITITQLSQRQTIAEILLIGTKMAVNMTKMQACVACLVSDTSQTILTEQWGLLQGDREILSNINRWPPMLKSAIGGKRTRIIRAGKLNIERTELLAKSTILIVPLLSRGVVLGSLVLLSKPGQGCGREEGRLAKAIAALLGLSLDNVRRLEEVQELADHDGITNLLNHRAIHERLRQEITRAQRYGQNLSILMIDLDGFKLFNDTHGHPAGDQMIKQVAGLFKNMLRDSDVLGRYGGDEFLAILLETDSDGAKEIAARLRAAIISNGYKTEDGLIVPVGASFGVASYPDDAQQIEHLVGIADVNLYESKRHGGQPMAQNDLPEEMSKTMALGVLGGLVTAVDNKDHYTRKHSEEVTSYALAIADMIGLSDQTQKSLRLAALLHDVGKIAVPDRILRKPGRLDDDELTIIRQHAQIGEIMIKELPDIDDVIAAVGSHHECYDGQGYPRGLKGEEIPLLGRILAVADAYSAMTSDRPYHQAMSHEQACLELRRVAGMQLDKELVDAFLKLPIECFENTRIAS